ncbi:TRAP transporter small permease [Paracoccus sp. Z118]|uniref:TRAP transporter small permease n=1 Tax=Paracoccus sp. Z118 TaxID=2851017 RepID=UPI001C2C5F34|nr:TRAP transporter small permease [Paracoccus sp. Z118]MBV0893296.1 TRAP transporter small permease [Paracoccus sp. Z118]
MRRLLNRFYMCCAAASCVSIIFIVTVVAAQVVLNLIDAVAAMLGLEGVGLMIPSYATFSGYGLAFATFLALGPAIRIGAHIRVTLIQERLPATVQRPLFVLLAVAGTLVGALMTWALGGMTIESFEFGDMSSGLVAIPLWIPQSVLTFGSFALTVACVDLAVEYLLFGRTSGLGQAPADEAGA